MKKRIAVVFSMVLGLSLMAGCGANEETTEATTEAVTEATTEVTEEETEATVADASSTDGEWEYGEYTYTGDDMVLYAISTYICDELAKGYEAADVGIPYWVVTERDESDPSDIKVYGDFWYMTYNLEGDTLVNQAGGSYPGCMHVETTDAGVGYVVKSFDPVADGSDFDESAKEIFGDYYDAFIEAYSDDELKDAARMETLVEYVTSHNVPATKYQDYGWDPVDLELTADTSADDDVVYMGGLYASDEECDANIALFKSSGTPIVIIQEGANIYYGEYETEEATLDDGSEYIKITVEGKTYGYHFDEDEDGNIDTTGFVVDQDGKKHFAKALDESVAMDMKSETE